MNVNWTAIGGSIERIDDTSYLDIIIFATSFVIFRSRVSICGLAALVSRD